MATKHTEKTNIETWLDNLEVDPAKARGVWHMRRITAAATALTAAETELNDAVAEARASGDTWAMVGTALGVSRQAAYQRFGKFDQ